ANGAIDTRFGNAGMITVANEGWLSAIAPDGKLLFTVRPPEYGFDPCIIRLNQDGSLDRTFNSGRPVRAVYDPAFFPDGAIVAESYIDGGPGWEQDVIVKLTPDGRAPDGIGPDESATGGSAPPSANPDDANVPGDVPAPDTTAANSAAIDDPTAGFG